VQSTTLVIVIVVFTPIARPPSHVLTAALWGSSASFCEETESQSHLLHTSHQRCVLIQLRKEYPSLHIHFTLSIIPQTEVYLTPCVHQDGVFHQHCASSCNSASFKHVYHTTKLQLCFTEKWRFLLDCMFTFILCHSHDKLTRTLIKNMFLWYVEITTEPWLVSRLEMSRPLMLRSQRTRCKYLLRSYRNALNAQLSPRLPAVFTRIIQTRRAG